MLLGSALIAIVWANSPSGASYYHLAHTPISISFGSSSFQLSLQHWINDLLMAVFFFVIGLEIKRELVLGELSTLQKAWLPVAAAAGGMLVPAAVYGVINAGGAGASGWGVPMATDIAFAIGVLAAFGTRVPTGLKVFLAALAIADDLGAVLVIALFYSEGIRWGPLAAGAVLLLLTWLTTRTGVRRPGAFIGLAVLVWAAVTASNLHPTVAGVLLALTIPVRSRREPEAFLSGVHQRIETLRAQVLTPESSIANRDQREALRALQRAASEMRPMGQSIEDYLHPAVAFVIVPLFAFLNAGVTVEASVADTITKPVGLGIVLGLVLGKQFGIMLFSWLAVKSGRAALPGRVTWSQIYGGACLAGIGFTMSLFVTDLAFPAEGLAADAKLAILVASLVAALWGGGVLHMRLPR